MKVELSRFRVKANKSARVDEWLKRINDRIDEHLQTLDREQMKLEVIFRELIDGEQYLYWFSVQGEQGESVDTSPHDVDKEHIKFSEECVDDDRFRPKAAGSRPGHGPGKSCSTATGTE